MKLPGKIREILSKLMTVYFRYVLLGSAALLAIIGYVVIIQPLFDKVQVTGILELQRQTNLLTERTEHLKKLEGMVDAYRKAIVGRERFADLIVPNSPEVPRLFEILNTIAVESGMTLDGVVVVKGTSIGSTGSTGTTTSGSKSSAEAKAITRLATVGTLQVLSVSYNVTGPTGYDSFKQLLGNLERSQRLFDLNSMTYQPAVAVSEEGAPTTNYSFNLQTYYLEPTGT